MRNPDLYRRVIGPQFAARPCPCGSNVAAMNCCTQKHGQFHKPPITFNAEIDPNKVPNNICYLGQLGGCSSKPSREHIVSASVLESLTDNAMVTVSGLHWQKPGETKAIGIEGLTVKSLCTTHNSFLSPLDTEAGRLATTIKRFEMALASGDRKSDMALFNGHDIERWLLKTLIAYISKGNFELPDGSYATIPLKWLHLLLDTTWPDGWGLYVPANVEGKEAGNHFHIHFFRQGDDSVIAGADFRLRGTTLRLLLADPIVDHYDGSYRPHSICIKRSSRIGRRDTVFPQDVLKLIEFSWQERSSGMIVYQEYSKDPAEARARMLAIISQQNSDSRNFATAVPHGEYLLCGVCNVVLAPRGRLSNLSIACSGCGRMNSIGPSTT